MDLNYRSPLWPEQVVTLQHNGQEKRYNKLATNPRLQQLVEDSFSMRDKLGTLALKFPNTYEMCTGNIILYTCSVEPQHTEIKYEDQCVLSTTDPTICQNTFQQVRQSGNCTKCMTVSDVKAEHKAKYKAAKLILKAIFEEFAGLEGLSDTLVGILEDANVRKEGLESLGWTFEGEIEGIEEVAVKMEKLQEELKLVMRAWERKKKREMEAVAANSGEAAGEKADEDVVMKDI